MYETITYETVSLPDTYDSDTEANISVDSGSDESIYIARVTINRPEVNNSLNVKSFEEIADVFLDIDRDETVRTVILTGNGKNFSAGGDINDMTTKGLISYESSKKAAKMGEAIKRCSKPVIAAINGTAAGAGLGLALACDLRVMSEKSKLMTAFVNMGLAGDTGTLYHLYHIVGLSKATELMMLSEPISGKNAIEMGLTTLLTEDYELEEKAISLAESLSQKPPIALKLQKELVYKCCYSDFDSYCEMEANFFDKCGETKDHMEAVTAFFEKRSLYF